MTKNPPSSPSPLMSLHAPWDHNENVIWLASNVRLCRNIEKFKFPHKLDTERKTHILQLTSKAFLQTRELVKPYILKADLCTPAEKEFLIEHFLLFEGFQEARVGCAFGLDETGEIIVIFNVKEHIQIQCTDCSGDLEKAWTKVASLEQQMAESISFAFLPKFGFLTSDLFHSGTGLLVSAYLHVPALIHTHTLTDHLEKEKSEGIITSGLQGSPDELVGDILMLRNLYTLGINEETIISTIRSSLLRLVIAEKDARSQIKADGNSRFKDLISRAIGLVKNCYQMDAPEALNTLSLLKLGIELGWVKDMSVHDINTLFFDTRRSHLTFLLSQESPSQDIAVRRAEYLRNKTTKLRFVA